MSVSVTRRAIVFFLVVGMTTLSGCLSSESDGGIAPGPPGTNGAPTISGNPAGAVRIGTAYSFTPNAWDPDDDALTFSVQNMPRWATFNTATGDLSGSPTLGDIGVYNGIGLSVSDGPNSASLAAFSVTVTQVALGSATLTWTPPTQNNDGTPLTDLAGFKIYYGTSPGNYPNSIRIDNPGIATYVVDNLTPTTYYFVSTAFNSSDIESMFSNEAIKTVN